MWGTRRLAVLALAGTVVLGGCDDDDEAVAPQNDIIEVATSAGSFTTLLAAVEAAGLTATLKGPGPFTVFAPTDAAFEALPPGTVESLLNDIPTLTAILTYHVVAGELEATDVVSRSQLTTVNGADIEVSVQGSAVRVNDANILQTDIRASNGVIHVIDAVILPPQE
jgi:uncharacterized surface protein with fasciclin (FAS1) repeats